MFYATTAVGGAATLIFMVKTIYTIIKNGTIERRPPFKPLTKDGTPLPFWMVVVFCSVGTVGIAWGLVVITFRFFAR